MLANSFDVHVVSTDPEPFGSELQNVSTVFGGDQHKTLLGGSRALNAYLQDYQPDAVVQVTNPPLHGVIAGSLSCQHGIPFVYRYAGDRFTVYKLSQGITKLIRFGLNNVLGRIPLRLAKGAIAMGPSGWNRLVTRNMASDSTTILPPPVCSTRFKKNGPTANIPVPENRSVVLVVGRLTYLKGSETLQRIIPLTVDRREDLHFVVVGNQTKDIELPDNYKNHFTCVGPVEPIDVPNYFRRADLLLHPSLTEGLPRVIAEALLTRTPVVARNVGDVAYATSNTFDTERELIQMLVNYESLKIDKGNMFSRTALQSEYKEYFRSLSNGS